jgi:hypothetical protein
MPRAMPAAVGVPAAGLAAAPGQAHMMAVYPMGPAPNGMSQLRGLNAIDVKEKANVAQEVTAMVGTEVRMANKYQILDTAGNQHFFAAERTACCRRQMQQLMCHDCVSWEVDLWYTPTGYPSQQFISVKRPCGMTCCCFNRPVANVIDDVTKAKIGSFRDPCTCCALQFQVRDDRDAQVLTVDGGCCCCQPGIWCPLPCGPCSKVAFDVKDSSSGDVVAHITKRVPSCLAWLFAPDIDNYHVTFEKVQNPQWKAILMAFTVFMDFRYFNTNRNNKEAHRLERDAVFGS